MNTNTAQKLDDLLAHHLKVQHPSGKSVKAATKCLAVYYRYIWSTSSEDGLDARQVAKQAFRLETRTARPRLYVLCRNVTNCIQVAGTLHRSFPCASVAARTKGLCRHFCSNLISSLHSVVALGSGFSADQLLLINFDEPFIYQL